MPVSMTDIRILLDNNVPAPLGRLLAPHETVHASALGWHTMSNDNLIRAARAGGFTVMVTCDRNIEHQQNLSGQSLSFVVLTNTHWPTIRDNAGVILTTIEAVGPGGYEVVDLPRPPLRRRAYFGPPAPGE